MTRKELLQSAYGHAACGEMGQATFALLILLDHDLVRIARALEAGNQARDEKDYDDKGRPRG